MAAATAVLALLFATGLIQPWHVFIILFVRSLGGMFHYPAMQASTSLMVPKEHLARIAGLEPAPARRAQHRHPAAGRPADDPAAHVRRARHRCGHRAYAR